MVLTVAKDIRIINAEIPIIFLTAKNLKERCFGRVQTWSR